MHMMYRLHSCLTVVCSCHCLYRSA